MNELWADIVNFFISDKMWSISRAFILIIVGAIVAKLASTAVIKIAGNKTDQHRASLLKRSTYYIILVLFMVSALNELGFDLSVLLGAAGILTVAIGFASQTSASNLISGLFWLLNARLAWVIQSVLVPQRVWCSVLIYYQ